MKIAIYLTLLISLFMLSALVHAEGNCPPGYFPTTPQGAQGPQGCAPIPGYNENNQSTQTPPPRWATRWGAIAYDNASTNRGIGVAINMENERLAKKAAMADCLGKGGAGCKIDLIYHNQCAVVTAADHFVQSQSAATIEEASRNGLKQCAESGASDCVIYYSACGLPEQIQ